MTATLFDELVVHSRKLGGSSRVVRIAICRSMPVITELAIEYSATPAEKCHAIAKVRTPVMRTGIACAALLPSGDAADTHAIAAATRAAITASQRSGLATSPI